MLLCHSSSSFSSFLLIRQLDLLSPSPITSLHIPPLFLILATTQDKTVFLHDYFSEQSTTAKLLVLISVLLKSLIQYNVVDELKSSIAAALRSSKHTLNAATLQQLIKKDAPKNDAAPKKDAAFQSMKYILLVGYLIRQLCGINMSTLQSKSVLQSVTDLSFDNSTAHEVIETSRSLVERLCSTHQSVDFANSTERRKLLASFFVCCNKSYVRLHALRNVLLIPMVGWESLKAVNINTNISDSNSDSDSDPSEAETEGHLRNERPCIVRGRFWTDLLSHLEDDDVHEILQTVHSVSLWDIFYRVSCLCDDPNDSFRILWKLADHLNAEKTNVALVRVQLQNEQKYGQSLHNFCRMIVNSLRSLGMDISNIDREESTECLKWSMRCLTKLIGILSDAEPRAWSSLVNGGAITALNTILLRYKHFNDNSVLNSITAMYCLTQTAIGLYERLFDDLGASDHSGHEQQKSTTHAGLERLWQQTTVKLSHEISELMFCIGILKVMNNSSCKIMFEAFELLVANVSEVWSMAEDTVEDNNRNTASSNNGGLESLQMSTLAESLSRANLVQSLLCLLRESEETDQQKRGQAGAGGGAGVTGGGAGKVVDGNMRRILNGKLGSEKGSDCAARLQEWVLWTVQNPWNGVLAQSMLDEPTFIDAFWDCMFHTKHGSGGETLRRLQRLKFASTNIRETPCARLLDELLEGCPELRS